MFCVVHSLTALLAVRVVYTKNGFKIWTQWTAQAQTVQSTPQSWTPQHAKCMPSSEVCCFSAHVQICDANLAYMYIYNVYTTYICSRCAANEASNCTGHWTLYATYWLWVQAGKGMKPLVSRIMQKKLLRALPLSRLVPMSNFSAYALHGIWRSAS